MDKKHKPRRFKTILRWIFWVFLIQFILINITSALYAYKLTHFYSDPSLNNPDPPRNIFFKTWQLFTGPKYQRSSITAFPSFPYETIMLETKNGLSIEAWYSKTDSVAKGTVILFHGVSIAKDRLLNEAIEFRNYGYHVMLVDFRGHGNSEGSTTTMGVKESEEVKLAYDHIKKLGEEKIFLWGSSMGAVVVIKAIADYKLKVSGIILEAPFASLQSHLKARARVLAFPRRPFIFPTVFWIGAWRGFNGFSVKTYQYAKKITCPVLVQWGSQDSYVLKWEIDSVFNVIPSSNKKLAVYENAFHESLLRRNKSMWRSEINSFLEKIEQDYLRIMTFVPTGV